jgi:hypothetical protein
MRKDIQSVLAGLRLVFRDFCFSDVIADANVPAVKDYRQNFGIGFLRKEAFKFHVKG